MFTNLCSHTETFGVVWSLFVNQEVTRCNSMFSLSELLELCFEIRFKIAVRGSCDFRIDHRLDKLLDDLEAAIQVDCRYE